MKLIPKSSLVVGYPPFGAAEGRDFLMHARIGMVRGPEIAAKAAQMKIASPEAMAIGRIFGKEGVAEILLWARSQGATEVDIIPAVRQRVEIGLNTKAQVKE